MSAVLTDTEVAEFRARVRSFLSEHTSATAARHLR